MFNKRKRDAAAAQAAAEIALARIEQLEVALKDMIEANEALSKRAFIVSIDRQNRVNKFTFVRNGEMYVIETMGLISDNPREWKEKLL